jgi:hypothetical protein
MQQYKQDVVLLHLHFYKTSLLSFRERYSNAVECQSTIDVINDSPIGIEAMTVATVRGCELQKYVFCKQPSDWSVYKSSRVVYTTWHHFSAQLLRRLPVDQTVVLYNTQTSWMDWEQASLLLQLKFQDQFARLPAKQIPDQWRIYQWPKLVRQQSLTQTQTKTHTVDLVLAMIPIGDSGCCCSNSDKKTSSSSRTLCSFRSKDPKDPIMVYNLNSGVVTSEIPGGNGHRYSGFTTKVQHLPSCDDAFVKAVPSSSYTNCNGPVLGSQPVQLHCKDMTSLSLSLESKARRSSSPSPRLNVLSSSIAPQTRNSCTASAVSQTASKRRFSWTTCVMAAFLAPQPEHPKLAMCTQWKTRTVDTNRLLEPTLRLRLVLIILCAWRVASAGNRATTLELVMEYISTRFQYPGILNLHAYQGVEEVIRILSEVEGFHSLFYQAQSLRSVTYNLGQLTDIQHMVATEFCCGPRRIFHSNPVCPSLISPPIKKKGSCFLTSAPWASCRHCTYFTLGTEKHVVQFSRSFITNQNRTLYLTVTNGRLQNTLSPEPRESQSQSQRPSQSRSRDQNQQCTILKYKPQGGCCTVQ